MQNQHTAQRCPGAAPALVGAALLAAGIAALAHPHADVDDVPTAAVDACVPVGQWRLAEDGRVRQATLEDIVARGVAAGVVLFGETHGTADHHRWQLQTLSALHARQPDLVIALEMLPRRAQPALDRWVAGEIDEQAFLRLSEWREAWGFDPGFYLPVLHFARMNRLPLVAVNVDRGLIRAVGERGFDAVPVQDREGVGAPAPAPPGYEEWLFESWSEHPTGGGAGNPHGKAAETPSRDDVEFRRFVESQLVWDRAMAQGIAEARERRPGALVVGLMGSGHVIHGWGVAHQLRALGGPAALALLPFDRGDDCDELLSGVADGVFGVERLASAAEPIRPRLGVTLASSGGRVRIVGVARESVAERAGLRAGDVIVTVAGLPAKRTSDVAAAVQRTAWGTWLPVEIERDEGRLEIVARFPPDPHTGTHDP